MFAARAYQVSIPTRAIVAELYIHVAYKPKIYRWHVGGFIADCAIADGKCIRHSSVHHSVALLIMQSIRRNDEQH